MQLIERLLQSLGIPAKAIAIVLICIAIGWWLEADATLKDHVRASLSRALWVVRLRLLTGSISKVFEKIFGGRYFSLRALTRCIQLQLIAFAVFIVLDEFHMYGFYLAFNDSPEGRYFVKLAMLSGLASGVIRAIFGVAIDFLSVIRVRFFLRHMETSAATPLRCLCFLISDIVYVIFVAVLTAILFHLVARLFNGVCTESGRLDSTNWLSDFIEDCGGTIVTDVLYAVAFKSHYSFFLAASVLPTLILVSYISAHVFLSAGDRGLRNLHFIARHLKYRKPLLVIAAVGGLGLASLYVIGSFIV